MFSLFFHTNPATHAAAPSMRPQARKWLLLADIHFKHADLDRINRTANWITQLAASLSPQLSRIVICGDLLTTRASQPTHVLSACYRFLDSLVSATPPSGAVTHKPHINILLGNHDLAYRRDTSHATSALDALRLAAPAGVELHWDVGSHVWDGRRVLTLPFREAQGELVEAVASLPDKEVEQTVAFAHLALHRAITQRYVVRPSSMTPSAGERKKGMPSVSYHGLVGPGAFARLARTFTGHFHSHQTILQSELRKAGLEGGGGKASMAQLQGSVTYVGSPLQLTWADLWDEQRGVVLLDPETLEHELVVNPHAVGYTTAEVDQVLDGSADAETLRDKHVMLLGNLTRFKYAAARDALVSLGARSIRNWSPITPRFQGTVALRGLGASMPASDAVLQRPSLEVVEPDGISGKGGESVEQQQSTNTPDLAALTPDSPQQSEQIDLQEQIARYVDALELDEQLAKSKNVLVQIGRNLLMAAASQQQKDEGQPFKGTDESEILDYRSILPPRTKTGRLAKSASASSADSIAHTALPSPSIFDAKPRSLTITNFLGVQAPLHLEFGVQIPRGLTFLVGENGSGKSTLIEAMVWCQFGKCLRNGLGANDIVNDKAKRNCSVRLEFDNGYAITRYRKHKEFGNRVLVELNGTVLPDFEAADSKTTQAGIDELLSMDYNTFLRTIVLGHESATSFLSSTPAQRRDLILSVLGLEILDQYATTTRSVLRGLNDDLDKMQSRVDGLEQTLNHVDERIRDFQSTQTDLEAELRQANKELQEVLEALEVDKPGLVVAGLATQTQLDERMSAAHQQVEILLQQKQLVDTRRAFEKVKDRNHEQKREISLHLRNLEDTISRLVAEKPSGDIEVVQPMALLANIYEKMQRLDASLDAHVQRPAPETLWPRVLRQLAKVSIYVLRLPLRMLRRLSGVDAQKEAIAKKEQKRLDYHAFMKQLEAELDETRSELSEFESLDSDTQFIEQVATDMNMSQADVQSCLDQISANDAMDTAKTISAQSDEAVRTLMELQSQRTVHDEEKARLEKVQAAITMAKEKMKTYSHILKTEVAEREKMAADRDVLAAEMETLAADRDLIDFWASALAQKSRRISSSSSSSAATSYTFRQFVLEQSLAELNAINTQILAILFEESRHSAALTTGMLRSLFLDNDPGSTASDQDGSAETAAALDSSLSVDPRLSYGKRSGGERKRIDLALFFALLYLGHSRSPHRAHYMLVSTLR